MDNQHELDDLKGERNYKGCLVKRIIGGFQIFGVNVTTALEVDGVIEKACNALSGSIVVVNNGSIACTNDFEGGFLADNSKDDTLYQEDEITPLKRP